MNLRQIASKHDGELAKALMLLEQLHEMRELHVPDFKMGFYLDTDESLISSFLRRGRVERICQAAKTRTERWMVNETVQIRGIQ